MFSIVNGAFLRGLPFDEADRIAYVCHDFEDAVRAGILTPADLPEAVADVVYRLSDVIAIYPITPSSGVQA